MSDEAQVSVKAPTLFRNYISFAGAVIVAASLASIILLFLIELTKAAENPYLGIVTYVILPAFLDSGFGHNRGRHADRATSAPAMAGI